MKNQNKKRAFTLIEISIVLVIIGIILASVMKGRDLIKSSQIKEFNQVFVTQWETIANSYFSRMAAVLADTTENGGTEVSIDGFMDGAIDTPTEYAAVKLALRNSGIDLDELIKSDLDDPFKRSVDGEFVGKKAVEVTFTNYILNGKQKNYLLFTNIPGDVAQAIDTIKDGSASGLKGSVVALPSEQTAGDEINGTIEDWDVSTTQAMAISLSH